jgi:hypothetical protein
MTRKEITNLYWFWDKKQKSPQNKRIQNQFKLMLICTILSMKYNGQTKAEFDKNYERISDIIKKSNDQSRQISLAKTQANRITDEWKCINRAMAAKEMGHEHIFDVFFRRAYELGSVGKQEYREYQLSKLGI